MEISELYDFEDRSTDIMTTLSYVWTSVIDANNMKAPSITPVIWSFPLIDRLKVDTHGAANGSLGLAGCWGLRHIYMEGSRAADRFCLLWRSTVN
ncbi:hypothetical protein TIFTF001_024555 [Ficus carica]|uniref:Uncharacterized protein n=1 Tax=Ficus carica TaxID=3494 RepID=A0AA88ALK8_FICCA|nr:hypothetical protein TIFTF001_024555 [Ficus carica]